MTSYEDVASRWRDRELGRTGLNNLSHRRMPAYDGVIQSYGAHFPLAVTLRDRKGQWRGWLINGDRFSNTTDRHQAVIRNVLYQPEQVTIPFSVLEEAGIVRSSIEIVENTSERTERWIETSVDFPVGAEWVYEHETLPGTGGYLVDGTFYRHSDLWKSENREVERRVRNRNLYDRGTRETVTDPGVVEVPVVQKNTGRRSVRAKRGYAVWEAVWDPDLGQVVYETERSRHWLGESLIRAQVRYRKADWSRATRWAYFLSGFDANESRPSYFFCELPRGAKPTTVAEAYEALKPGAVKTAESLGIEVTRQGDIFAIPVSLTLKELKTLGGRHHKRQTVDEGRWRGVRPSADSFVLGTNHTASEVVRVGRLTYARGTMRHEPAGRQPDHARRRLGDGKTWHLIVKNTVPTVAAPRRRQTASV